MFLVHDMKLNKLLTLPIHIRLIMGAHQTGNDTQFEWAKHNFLSVNLNRCFGHEISIKLIHWYKPEQNNVFTTRLDSEVTL
jgi:hypothetical protein